MAGDRRGDTTGPKVVGGFMTAWFRIRHYSSDSPAKNRWNR
ncbi:hypothetical protein [Citrobacter amalonaticus]|nr:hypothetical protein [Citrobacter amalonaticus]